MRLRKPLLILAGVIVLLLAACFWLSGTTSGARAAFAVIESLSDGTLTVQGIQGTLSGPLRFERLTLNSPDRQTTLSNLQLDWRPQALLANKLHVTRLHIGHLATTGKIEKAPEPPKLPERLALPLAVQADDVQLAGGEVNRGPVNLLRLGPLAFGLDFDGARYRLQLRSFAAGAAQERGRYATRISGQATLSATKPYALDAAFSSESDASIGERAIGATGRIGLGGSLAELRAHVSLEVNQAHVDGNAILRPFSPQPLGKAQLTVRALDLSRLDAGLPHTTFDVDLSALENGSGVLKLSNAEAGSYDARRIPLSSFELAFRQEPGQWHFDRIDARLGTARQPAGKLAGRGRFADGALTLSLHTEALDLQRIDRRARPTQLEGELDLRHAEGKQEFTLTMSEPIQAQRITLNTHGALADTQLTIDRFDLQAGSSRIEASGHVALAGAQSFDAKAQVSRFRLQELGKFPQLPALELNGKLALRGTRQPQLEADLTFQIADSRLAGQPLHGEGEAQLRADRLQVPRFVLESGANRLRIEGQLADSDAQLTFTLAAPQLQQLGPAFGGTLQANGTVRGSLMRPRISAQWSASHARLPGPVQLDAMQGKAELALDRKRPFVLDHGVADISARGMRYGDNRLAGLSAQLRFAPRPNAPLALSVRADGIATGQLLAESFIATANGTTSRHSIELALNEAGQSWHLKAAGGLSEVESSARWKGSIDTFDAGGRFTAHLAAPAPLLASAQRMQLERFLLESDNGRIALEHFARGSDGITTRGRVERLQVAQLLQHASPAAQIKTDLQLGGEWDVRIAETLGGVISLRRERGDVTMLGSVPLTLGLRDLSANATVHNGKLALRMQADGRQLGSIDVAANTVVGDGSNRLAIAPDAPIAGSARIAIPSLAWVASMISPAVTADGKLQSEISLGGTYGQPRLDGRIAGDALKLSMPAMGLDLRAGVLDSEFQGDRLLIRNLRFQGDEGQVALSGPIDLGGGTIAAQLALHAERFALLNRADRRIVVSGDSKLDWQDRSGKLAGAFTVNSGFIDLGHADKPQLSDDVVIVGREKKQAPRSAFAVDVDLSLGDGVTVTGRGLDALLGGQIRVLSDAGETLQAQGSFQVIKGTFEAYGRKLAIEQGALRFRGSIANPALDILAMRRGQEVEAGVSVRGNVLAPRITLVSEPTVPEAEKLSWLVLGRGLASAGESDVGALQAAAGALLSEGAKAGVQSRIAGMLGLDTFNVGTSQGNLQQRIVTLGKQISSKLYVSYQQGLEKAGSVIQLRYVLSPKLSVEAEAGTRSAISLFYNIAFD